MDLRAHRDWTGRRAAWMVCAAILILTGHGTSIGIAQTRMDLDAARSAMRLVFMFDFDEPENFDTIPQSWIRFPGVRGSTAEFPRFTRAGFDKEVGHEAPPSFHLASDGRSIAFRYIGPNTRVRPGEYVVTGWVRPDRLVNARAALSAYYLDWQGNYLPGSQRFSELVDGSSTGDAWRELVIRMPSAPPEAYRVGLTCWVVQQDIWRPVLPHRHILDRDPEGGAWFDDIRLVGLPGITLTTDQPGGIVTLPQRLRLRAGVIDESPEGLSSQLVVRDHRGREIFSREVPVTRLVEATGEIQAIDLELDEPGLYTAQLSVAVGGERIHEERLSMAVLRPSPRPPTSIARRFGVVIDRARPSRLQEQIALLTALGVGSVRLPIWSDDPKRPGYESAMPALSTLLENVLSRRLMMIGELGRPSRELRGDPGSTPRTLVDVLSLPPQVWHDILNAMVAPYATIFRAWQIGNEWDLDVIDDVRLPDVLAEVRTAMLSMVTEPTLAAVASATRSPGRVSDVEQILTIAVPADARPDQYAVHLDPFRKLGYEQLWVSLPAPESQYYADEALTDWVQRILAACWVGADVVFVPMPWLGSTTDGGDQTQPGESFIALRTLADAVGDARPTDQISFGESGVGLAFADGERAVAVLWDQAAPPMGRRFEIQLGSAREAFDLWGRTVPLSRTADGRHVLELGAGPVFVRGIERWLIAFRAGLKLTPQKIGFSQEGHRHELAVYNPNAQAITGEIDFQLPANWEVDPRRLQFTLYPGETRTFDLVIRHPLDTTAGTQTVTAKTNIKSGNGYRMNVPLTIEIGLDDVDVAGYAVTDGPDLILRHSVTNRSGQTLSFRSAAVVPGRTRQYRVINALLPGQMLTTEYRFRDAADQAGRILRLALDEVNGPRSHRLAVSAP